MSFYNTGNPVPSIDPRDLDDNAKHIDEIVNSTLPTFTDRLGAERRTLAGIEADADAIVLRDELAAPDGADLVGFLGRSVYDTLKAFPTPDQYGADNTGAVQSDDAFADAFSENLYVRLEQGGIYVVNSPIIMRSNQTLDINGAVLRAGPLFVGNSIIEFDREPPVDGNDQPSWNVNVTGKGKIDCAFMCDWGIEVDFARECDIDVQMIVRARLGGAVVGTHPTMTSTGVNFIGVSAWFHEEYAPQPGYEINNPNGIGIYHKNCSDSYVHRCFSVGYRKGFFSGFSIDYTNCHAWSRRAHGPLVKCFETIGDDGSFIGCYADTPHNWKWVSGYAGGTIVYDQDAAITEVIGFDHSGTTVNVIGCKCLLASDANFGATDGLFIPVGFPVAGNTYGTISGLSLAGATTVTRYKSVYKNFDATATIVGYRDKGSDRFVSNTNRGNILSNSRGLFMQAPRVETTALIDSVGTGVSEIGFRRGTSYRWTARMNSGAEPGSNAGSDFTLNFYSDAGAFLGTAVTVKRDSGFVSLGGILGGNTFSVNNNNATAATVAARLRAHPTQSADILQCQSSGGSSIAGVNKSGAVYTALNTVPADADIVAGQCLFWFDSTNGAAKLMIKAKQADGTVRTGSVALA